MITKNQLLNNSRLKKKKKNKVQALRGNPQKKAECLKILHKSPKKPNSAIRKVAKVKINYRLKTIRNLDEVKNPKEPLIIEAYIPGESHNLKQNNTALMRGGRTPDLPGLKYKLIPGALNFEGSKTRKTSRSLYGTKKDEKK